MLLATAGATLNRGHAQFLAFHFSFGALEVFCLLRVTWIALRPENRPVRARFTIGLAAYATGVAIWFVDLEACARVHGLQLHAAWHVLVSIGFFLLLGVISFDRLRRGGEEPVTAERTSGSLAQQPAAPPPGPPAGTPRST